MKIFKIQKVQKGPGSNPVVFLKSFLRYLTSIAFLVYCIMLLKNLEFENLHFVIFSLPLTELHFYLDCLASCQAAPIFVNLLQKYIIQLSQLYNDLHIGKYDYAIPIYTPI
ncbi:hypothetical protein BpHYR1_038039 [Brachionus plicatilis]|uniref:Uncharacterized protein n=1 Tax=Brachionus plicatilis TaxID=10195 RepID=A0A3M7QCI5_BRAPC|nr:hypothetical protein BpHYR1_038039 [Brachionus plicatilis]